MHMSLSLQDGTRDRCWMDWNKPGTLFSIHNLLWPQSLQPLPGNWGISPKILSTEYDPTIGTEWVCTGLALRCLDKDIFTLVHGLYHQATVVGALTEQQKAELILDPGSGALEDVSFVREVLTSLKLSGKDEQLTQFFQTFAQISEKVSASH